LIDGGPVIATPPEPNGAIDTALLHAPDLAALEQAVHAADVRAAGARDAAMTRLDVVTTVGAGGLWANDSLDGLRLPGGRPAMVGTVGLELELPAGSNQADGNLASALAARSQAEAQLDALKAQLRADVASSHETLTSALARVQLSQDSVNNARAVVEGEQHRLSLGTATSADVIIAQQTHREAELRRLRALVDAAVASARLRHATGQLLADNRELANGVATARGGNPR
jgi:outer membrane protein TolC